MKYLKYLQTANDFESFKNSEDYVLPNVSYVEETKGVSYEPYTSPEPIVLIDGNYYLDLLNKLQQIAEKYVSKYNITNGSIDWYKDNPMIISFTNENDDRIYIDIERSESEIFNCITFTNYPTYTIAVHTRFSDTYEYGVNLQDTNYRTGYIDYDGLFTLVPIIS
jgi:hypothetical protein